MSNESENTRIVKDSMGKMEIPVDALHGAQTQRALNNFPISGRKMPEEFIQALLLIKLNAAKANLQLKTLPDTIVNAIVDACNELMEDKQLMNHFPVDVFQTGSGTSSNMNANEVIATVATKKLGNEVNPNDHVNFGQSSNDVIPTAIQVSAVLTVNETLLPALKHLQSSILMKADAVSKYCKTGRTHLMDAMPIRMDQSLICWADQVKNNINQIESVTF